MDGIICSSAIIVSDGSFDPESPIGSTGSSAVILATSTKYVTKFYAKWFNWVTGYKSAQSAYQSELAGIISVLGILDILVSYHNITEGAVTIALSSKSSMDEIQGDWPLSIDQKSFDYLQVIWAWINLSSLSNKKHPIQTIRWVGAT